MHALRLYAGPLARKHIEQHGLQPADVGVVPGAAGGPKGLILGPLDRFLFGEWLAQSEQPIDLVGASIGAWRMATACLDEPVAAFQRLEHDYIAQHYALKPGQKRPTAQFVSEQFGQSLQDFYGGRVHQVLNHPRFRLHVLTSRGRHVLGREGAWRTPLGYLGAFLTNTARRKAMGAWLERVVFSSGVGGSRTGLPALPFGTADFRTRRVLLGEANFNLAVQASCSIPFVLNAVHDIPGAPRGAYWDGGIIDYHLHLDYLTDKTDPDLIVTSLMKPRLGGNSIREECEKTTNLAGAGGGADKAQTGRLVLYPHFQKAVVPGWLDKGLKWRHKATRHLDKVLLLAPNPDWVKTLPNAKLPDRKDFTHYGNDFSGRVKAWRQAAAASQQLADEFAAWLQKPDAALVQPL
jgi:hypothetical protein